LPRLKSFHQAFSSTEKPNMALFALAKEDEFKNWLSRENRGAVYVYRHVSGLRDDHAVIAFHPRSRNASSAIWIHHADFPEVIAFFESILKPDEPAPTQEFSHPPSQRAVGPVSRHVENEWETFDEPDDDFEATLQTFDEVLRDRHERAVEQYDDDERLLEEDWPYPDSDEDN